MAGAIRPGIVGSALQELAKDPEVFAAMFDVLETQHIINGEARITLVPPGNQMLTEMLAGTVRGESRKSPDAGPSTGA